MTKKKVLLADDDPGICESISMILEDSGYEVSIGRNGQIVKSAIQANPDLILLDIWLAGLDGSAICRQLKIHPKTKHIPIIMVSANKDTRKIALKCGANNFIAKPFEMDEFIGMIKRYTR